MRRFLVLLAMVVVVLGLAAAALLGRLSPPKPLAPPARGAVFDNVTVVEPGLAHWAGRRVVVEGTRIAAIEEASPGSEPRGFLLPGLIDMHVHGADESIAGQADLFRLLYLAHGVTTVRNTGGWKGQLDERDRIARGEIAGPRIFACGRLVDGDPPIWGFSQVLEDPEGADALVAEHVATGFDCLKVYERLRPEVLDALVAAARARDLTVVGHVPVRVRFENAGIDDVQHLRGLAREEGREPISDGAERLHRRLEDWAELSSERIAFVTRVSLEQGVAQTPTLVLFDRMAKMDRVDELIAAPALQLLPRFYGELSWDPRGFPWYEELPPGTFDLARRGLVNAKRLVGALFRAGVRIHAGTDVGNPFLVPGASLQEELGLLVESGLSPEQAWMTATLWPGEFLGEPDLGRIVPGAPADLLLFEEDPTRDLAALSSLRAVVADGRLYSRETLDAALARARDHYRSALYERVSMAIGGRQRAQALEREREEAAPAD